MPPAFEPCPCRRARVAVGHQARRRAAGEPWGLEGWRWRPRQGPRPFVGWAPVRNAVLLSQPRMEGKSAVRRAAPDARVPQDCTAVAVSGNAALEIWAAPDFIAQRIAQDHFEVGLSV